MYSFLTGSSNGARGLSKSTSIPQHESCSYTLLPRGRHNESKYLQFALVLWVCLDSSKLPYCLVYLLTSV